MDYEQFQRINRPPIRRQPVFKVTAGPVLTSAGWGALIFAIGLAGAVVLELVVR